MQQYLGGVQCDQIRRFIGLWAIFVKVLKSIIFLMKSFLGNFYRFLAIFFWSHWWRLTLSARDDDLQLSKRSLNAFFMFFVCRRRVFTRTLVTKVVKNTAEFERHIFEEKDQSNAILPSKLV